MIWTIALGLLAWCVLPLPLAVLVGRFLSSGQYARQEELWREPLVGPPDQTRSAAF